VLAFASGLGGCEMVYGSCEIVRCVTCPVMFWAGRFCDRFVTPPGRSGMILRYQLTPGAATF